MRFHLLQKPFTWSEWASVDSGITDVTDFVMYYLDSEISQIHKK